jgi:hypothetical protein
MKSKLAEEDLLIDAASDGRLRDADRFRPDGRPGQDAYAAADRRRLRPRTDFSKVQTMRKEAGFEVMDRISVYAQGNEKIQEDHGRTMQKKSGTEVLADSLSFDAADGYVKDWKMNGETVTLGVKKN